MEALGDLSGAESLYDAILKEDPVDAVSRSSPCLFPPLDHFGLFRPWSVCLFSSH